MKNKLKYFVVFTTLITLLFTSSIFADDTIYTEGSLKYKINDDGTVTIVDYFGVDKEVKVPMNMGMYIVTEIGPGAFKDSDIEKIELPDTITEIDAESFDNIENIKIESFDKDNQVIENNIVINFPEKTEENTETSNVENKTNIEETENNESSGFDITVEELFEEESPNITNSNDEHSSNISLNANEKDDLNSGVFTKTMNITTGGYLLIVAIVLIILIGIVLIIRKKENKNK